MSGISLIDCDVFYGATQALHSVTIDVRDGELVSLVGRNGAGKSTLLKTLMGLLDVASGGRLFGGADVTKQKAHELSRLGIGFVPEDRRIFPNLSVEENLSVAAMAGRTGYWNRERVLELFPELSDRLTYRGNALSGGEQQMLSIARSLLTNPRVLLLDEPTEGLAPLIVENVVGAIEIISRQGVGILLVEQNLKLPMKLAQRQYVLDSGRIAWSGTTVELEKNRQAIEKYISL